MYNFSIFHICTIITNTILQKLNNNSKLILNVKEQKKNNNKTSINHLNDKFLFIYKNIYNYRYI